MGVELLSGLDLLFGLRGSRVCVGLLSGLDFVRVYVGLLFALDLLFGLRGRRAYFGLLSGLDFRLSVFDLGCGVWVRVRGSGGGFDWVCGALGGNGSNG